MKNTALPLGLAAIALLFNIVEIRHFKLVSRESPEPNDYLFLQRAFPYDQIPSGAYYEAVEWVQGQAESPSNSVQWELAGPARGGGRITDVAMHAAGITLMRGDPLLVAAALDISRRTVAKIRQNLFWALVYNVAGIPLAALGYLNPVMAGAAMALSSVSVMSNALLLKRWKP